MKRTGERVVLFFVRPIYRTFVERPLWWFVARVKVFFLAEISPQLESIGRQLEHERQLLANIEHRIMLIEHRLSSIEQGGNAQWDSLEQLLLALYRQPEIRTASPDAEPAWSENHQSKTHAAGYLR